MKDVNKLVVTLLAHLDRSDPNWAGDAVIEFLEEQTADARAFPSNDELVEQLPHVRAYGNIRQPRLRAILSAVERHFRTARHESVSLPDRLELEHIMPRKWREHWNADAAGDDPRRAAQRDRLVDTLGNLTLVTRSLNGSLSNRPWHRVNASGVDDGKRALIGDFSLLVLNKKIVDGAVEEWTERDILARGTAIAQTIAEIWPHTGTVQ